MIPKIVIKQLNTHVFFYFEEWNKMLVQRCFNVYNVSTTFYNVYNVGTTLLQRLQCWHNVVQCLQVSTTLLQRLLWKGIKAKIQFAIWRFLIQYYI